MWDVIVVGCGLSGMVAARELAERGKRILILEKRNHIGGNIFDCVDGNGFLVQKYGPHCFFTEDYTIKEYVEKFVGIEECFVKCQTMIDGMAIPMPFNFQSIDILYEKSDADNLKMELLRYFKDKEIVYVTDLLECPIKIITDYGKFMYEKEYMLYTAKQWGRTIESISPDIFKRVPVYLSYRKEYQYHRYQFLPRGGFTKLAESILDHENIEVQLESKAELVENIDGGQKNMSISCHGTNFEGPIIFTGELDSLFGYRYGRLPYRSLEFVWKTYELESYQDTEIVAWPQKDKITRVTEYKKMPIQEKANKTVISVEIPLEYDPESPIGNEPYYPIKNDENDKLYLMYKELTANYRNLFCCGRLADYKYYNMDMVINRALQIADEAEEYIMLC